MVERKGGERMKKSLENEKVKEDIKEIIREWRKGVNEK